MVVGEIYWGGTDWTDLVQEEEVDKPQGAIKCCEALV
jgi:hypothetical protein